MKITTTTGTMNPSDEEIPSIDDMNDIISAAVESENPKPRGGFETDDDEDKWKESQGARFHALCEASIKFNPMTTEQFSDACSAWLAANPRKPE